MSKAPFLPPLRRRLVVVMFTDIAGFSTLADRDEETAVRLLIEHNRLVRACIGRHKGTVVKTIGDAFMGAFTSAAAAVNCATDIQNDLRRWNRTKRPDHRLRLRIGIHAGDAVILGQDIIGVVANLAKWVESQARIGAICCTDIVKLAIGRPRDYSFKLLRKAIPKGTTLPANCYIVTRKNRDGR